MAITEATRCIKVNVCKRVGRYCDYRSVEEAQVFAVIGEDGFRRLVQAFYAQVPGDDVLGPMYPAGDFAGAEQRLLGFLIFRFGGPQTYIEERGHPRLRMRHAPFAIGQAARDHWMELMTRALDQAQLPTEARLVLEGFFAHTATFLMNRQEPL
jgi:hemoglobin